MPQAGKFCSHKWLCRHGNFLLCSLCSNLYDTAADWKIPKFANSSSCICSNLLITSSSYGPEVQQSYEPSDTPLHQQMKQSSWTGEDMKGNPAVVAAKQSSRISRPWHQRGVKPGLFLETGLWLLERECSMQKWCCTPEVPPEREQGLLFSTTLNPFSNLPCLILSCVV